MFRSGIVHGWTNRSHLGSRLRQRTRGGLSQTLDSHGCHDDVHVVPPVVQWQRVLRGGNDERAQVTMQGLHQDLGEGVEGGKHPVALSGPEEVLEGGDRRSEVQLAQCLEGFREEQPPTPTPPLQFLSVLLTSGWGEGC